MAGINKVIILGRLGQDPEIRYMANGNAVANLSVATSENWKDDQGQKQERTEWHRVVIFGKLADVAGQYLQKGYQVYIEGKLQTKKWQDQQGQDRYTTEIVVQGFGGTMQMLDNKQSSNGQANNQGGYQQQTPQQGDYQQQPQQQAPQQRQYAPVDPSFDDDIPFRQIPL